MENNHLHCAFCDTITETKFIILNEMRNGKNYEIQIYSEVCPKCKEQYYDADELINLEKVIEKDSVN